ncbi:putative retroelement protein [Tricholoma matsutake]|nr:putative retroelement protein [Tricholoma matsutake 945]
MITSHIRAWQPHQEPWSQECLICEHAIALGQAINVFTWNNYGSTLNSYLTFFQLHDMSMELTPDMLSLYTVYMRHHIKPKSMDTYLSGICSQLEPYFKHVHEACNTCLVHCTLKGCKRLWGTPTCALTITDLVFVCTGFHSNPTHDDTLFCAQLCIGFFALMHLGELTFPDSLSICNPWKLSRCTLVILQPDSFQFFLPGHKADRFFKGNIIILCSNGLPCNPMMCFQKYLVSYNSRSPLSSPSWLTVDGTVPTHSFFMHHLHQFFNSNIGGQSMHAGGATSLTENGVAPHIIQGIGRWASAAW